MRDIVALDGEGITVGDKHHYIMLCYRHSNGEQGMLYDNGNPLSTIACLDFLKSIATTYQNAWYVMYVHSYDVNKWLKDLHWNTLQTLRDYMDYGGKKAHMYGYRVRYIPRKEFILSWPKDAKHYQEMTIWDIFGYFQSSFVEAIETWLGKDYKDLENIRLRKSQRNTFQLEQAETMAEYCYQELETLILLTQKILQYSNDVGLHLKKLNGAGSVAGALLSKHKIEQYMPLSSDKHVEQMALHAYFGGRIELMKIGHTDTLIYHYDIRSAYPSKIIDLPNMRDGTWKKTKKPDSKYCLCHIKWQSINTAFHPFPYRTKQNQILYPQSGEGVYWRYEIDVALLHGCKIEFIACYNFYPKDEIKPFYFVRELYQYRKQLKKDGNGAEKMIKLGLNSLYGKMAEKTMMIFKDKVTPPRYHNIFWAGMITSATRAQLYHAAMQHPEAIVMFQTDGICSTLPLRLNTNNELGAWEQENYSKLTTVQSGVYFAHVINMKTWEEDIQYKMRGFDKGSINEDIILKQWEENYKKITYEDLSYGDYGKLTATMTRFVTFTSSLQAISQRPYWGTFYTTKRELKLGPIGTKRTRLLGARKQELKPWLHLIDTLAKNIDQHAPISKRYERAWDEKDEALPEIDLKVLELEISDTDMA